MGLQVSFFSWDMLPLMFTVQSIVYMYSEHLQVFHMYFNVHLLLTFEARSNGKEFVCLHLLLLKC